MNVTISPHSGHDNSYFDISFIIEPAETANLSVTIQNLYTSEQLEIIGVLQGHIINGVTAEFKKTNRAEGFFNLFNDDKLNTKLDGLKSIDLQFVIQEELLDGQTKTHTVVITFYNEGQSVDANIVPFDVIIDNPVVDITNNEVLKLKFICNTEKLYELCIKSNHSEHICTFQVFMKKGVTNIEIPAEILHWDLQLWNKEFNYYDLYYVKFYGLAYSKLANRKYIKIHNSSLRFRAEENISPLPQTRTGPTGIALSSDFILSDRYLVHTYKDFSSLSGIFEYSSRKLDNITRMFIDSHDIYTSTRETSSQEIKKALSYKHKSANAKQARLTDVLAEKSAHQPVKTYHKVSRNRAEFLRTFSSEPSIVASMKSKVKEMPPVAKRSKEPCLPCLRNKKK